MVGNFVTSNIRLLSQVLARYVVCLYGLWISRATHHPTTILVAVTWHHKKRLIYTYVDDFSCIVPIIVIILLYFESRFLTVHKLILFSRNSCGTGLRISCKKQD
jgi:hypothetical protein